MEKVFKSLLYVCVMAVVLTFFSACDDNSTGTVIPTSTEMQKNLESNGYTVEVTDELQDGYTGTHLTAKKGNEYIEVFWLVDPEACDLFYSLLHELYPNNNKLVEMKNDEKFGNIVFCGSESAVNASGIKIVEVKV